MEYSLHRELKRRYAGADCAVEVRLPGYRIDAVRDGELIEIQHGSLSAIRDKVRRLLVEHRVRVVKPIVVRKLLVKRSRRGGPIVERRQSPGRWTLLDAFDELIYFTRVFPHPRLAVELVPVEVEEWRWPRRGRRRYRRRDYHVEDQKLLAVGEPLVLATAADLRRLIDCPLPMPFDTGQLAAGLGIKRWEAQRAAYCLRKMGAAEVVGKRGNAMLYEFSQLAAAPNTRSRRARRRAG